MLMGFGYAGQVSRDRQRELIVTAMQKGNAKHNRTNIEVEFRGDAYPLITFEGPAWVASGLMQFYHHGSRVMAVDFLRDRITDFGYTGYSMTTNVYLNAWSRTLGDMFFQGVECLRSETNPFRWTVSDRYNKNSTDYYFSRGAGHAKDMFMRFRAGVPWVKEVDGSPWFFGQHYNARLEDHFNQIRSDILRDGVGWHWFTADWNAHGEWGKRFIDDAAKKRWEKREAKRLRYDSAAEAA
jgi:hypothetical protein